MIASVFKKILLSLAMLSVTASLALAAMSITDAKMQGLVGEKPDGLVGIVSTATPDVETLVDQINQERMAKYEAIAAKNGTNVRDVQALAGKKLIDQAANGEYIMTAAGTWERK